MNNIQIVQAAFIQRRVQKEYEQSGKDWLEIIEEEGKRLKTLYHRKGGKAMYKVIYKDEYTNATGLIAECETLEKAEGICKEVKKYWEDIYVEEVKESDR